jgi:MFS family permease
MVATIAQTRIYEDIICRRYYIDHPEQSATLSPSQLLLVEREPRQHSPDESLCKRPPIQDALNQLFGWQTFFDGIPGLIFAMYYGSLADSKGRRPVLILSLVGQLLGAAWILFMCWIEADMRLVWVSSVFTCLGGGNTVFAAAAMMILADSIPDTSRARVFFYAGTFFLVGEILGPLVAAALVARDPWIPNILGFLCVVMATALALVDARNIGGRGWRWKAGRPRRVR